MQQVKQAAIAPADPSPQDQQVAVEASRKLAEVRSKMQENGGREAAESSADSQFSNDPPPSGTENDRGFEGPEDIGIDVDQRTGTYIADRRSSSSNESGSALNVSSEGSDTSAAPDLLEQFVTGTSNQLSAGCSEQVFTAIA